MTAQKMHRIAFDFMYIPSLTVSMRLALRAQVAQVPYVYEHELTEILHETPSPERLTFYRLHGFMHNDIKYQVLRRQDERAQAVPT